MILKLFLAYLILINLVNFILFGIDKYRARHGKWRIPEATLFTVAIIGGSIGAYVGMSVWRHKTKHKQFTIGIPLIILLQLALYWIISNKIAI